MRRPIYKLAFLVAFLFSTGVIAQEVTRYAVIVGNNSGLARIEPLKYAERDAGRMGKLLQSIGGIPEENMVLLKGQGPDELRRAFDEIVAQASNDNRESIFLFYYSGHADSGWLRTNGRGISLSEIRRRLELMPAKVKVAIVDACQSGEITRSKGGKVVSPFAEDRPVNVEGLVILTSASADEPAQESEILRSSFFSHHLMSGLRGPADATGDGRVSAIEAYEYAYRYTVQETEGTTVGTQHPTFLYALEGEGGITITSVLEGNALLELSDDMEGTLLFVGGAGQIEAEVIKKKGKSSTMAFAPGSYEIRWRSSSDSWIANVSLTNGEKKHLTQGDFEKRDLETGTRKGQVEEQNKTDDKKNGSNDDDTSAKTLTDIPLGGGASWGQKSTKFRDVEKKREEKRKKNYDAVEREIMEREGPVYDGSDSNKKRDGAMVPPVAAFGISLVVPGIAQGLDGRYSRAGLITGVFVGSLSTGLIAAASRHSGDSNGAAVAKLTTSALGVYSAFYTYLYGAIDGYYSYTKGGPGIPDFKKLKLDVSLSSSPILIQTAHGIKGDLNGGFGFGVAVHKYVVVGFRDIAFYWGKEAVAFNIGPELKVRGMFTDRLGWSASIGATGQIQVEKSRYSNDMNDDDDTRTGWSIYPYLAGKLLYFPARCWSLDFGLRGGMTIGTRRFLKGEAQSSMSGSVEYLGGVTWYH